MARVGETLQLKAGTDRTYKFTMYSQSGSLFTDFTSSATVTGRVWRGDDQAVLLTLTGDATDAATGIVYVPFTASNTTSFEEGLYRFDVLAAEGGVTRTVFDGRLEVSAKPGSATAPTTYCTYEDMKRYAPWIGDLADADEDQQGFAEQRHQARLWLESLAHAHYRGSAGDVAGGYWTLLNVWGRTRRAGRDTQLQTWLEDSRLIVRPDVVEVTAKQALYYLLLSKLTPGSVSSGNGYGALAARFNAEAKTLASTMTLELDTSTTADGEADTFIDLTVTDTLYA